MLFSLVFSELQDNDSEPPYETIPSVPPNINIIANIEAVDNFVNTTTAPSTVVKNNSNSITNVDTHMPHDDSVISAHDTGIYHLNKSCSVDSNPTTSASTSSIPNLQHHGNNVELLRKKLLMQDANETRL